MFLPRSLFPALLLALVLAPAPARAAENRIVATTPYGADLVKELSCKAAPPALDTLVGAGADPHSYSLLPADRARLAKAKVVISIHPTFESWLPRKDRAPGALWIALADGLRLAKLAGTGGHAHASAQGHGPEVDPHIWHSPKLTVAASERLAKALGEAFPLRASEFLSCQKTFADRARALEADLKATVDTLPKAARVLATNHDAFGYFASAFGFEVLAVQGGSTEAAPTPARLKRVVDGVRKAGVKAVFLESSVPARTMESVARETGVKIGGSLFADGLGAPGSGAETTLALWRKNVETVVSALR